MLNRRVVFPCTLFFLFASCVSLISDGSGQFGKNYTNTYWSYNTLTLSDSDIVQHQLKQFFPAIADWQGSNPIRNG